MATASPPTSPRRRGAALLFRRAITLAVLTLLVPGSAQYFVGNRRLGRAAMRVWLGVVAVMAVLVVLALAVPSALVRLGSSASLLSLVQAVLVLLAIGWLALFFDAWRLGRPMRMPRRRRLIASGATGLIAVATSAALLMSSHYMGIASASLTTIFTSTEVKDSDAGRFNVLLLGADAAPDRVGLRPDSMTLASIDEDTGATVLFSFPRNLQKVPFRAGSVMAAQFPNGYACGETCLLNAVYTWATEHKGLWPDGVDPGLDAVRSAIEGITGLTVNYYALVDMFGFRALVDAVGGIDVTVTDSLPIGGSHTDPKNWLLPGRHHFDGAEALGFARSRVTSSDYSRMARQKCLMAAMLNQLDPATVLTRFQRIARAGEQLMQTDIPASQISTFLTLAKKAKDRPLVSVAFIPPLVDPISPDFEAIRATVADTIAASEADDTAVDEDGATTATTTNSTTTNSADTTHADDGGAVKNAGTAKKAGKAGTAKKAGKAGTSDKVMVTDKPDDAHQLSNPDPVSDDLAATCTGA